MQNFWYPNIKGIGRGGQMAFLIFLSTLFNLVLTKLQDAFYRFLEFKIIFEIKQVKVGDYKRFLMGGAN